MRNGGIFFGEGVVDCAVGFGDGSFEGVQLECKALFFRGDVDWGAVGLSVFNGRLQAVERACKGPLADANEGSPAGNFGFFEVLASRKRLGQG